MTEHTPSPSEESNDPSLGELVSRMSEQTSRLIRDELRLAQAEMTAKAKKAGLGAGLFGGAGLMALYGLGALVAAAILALAGPLKDWLAALIIGGALLVVAGLSAIVGKGQVTQATPPLPEEAVAGIKRDVQTLNPRNSS
ncbi:MAG: phage holin family protein [Actinomycetota bacterium]|nr:phage holin family protein [Actinomycetota bacterium]